MAAPTPLPPSQSGLVSDREDQGSTRQAEGEAGLSLPPRVGGNDRDNRAHRALRGLQHPPCAAPQPGSGPLTPPSPERVSWLKGCFQAPTPAGAGGTWLALLPEGFHQAVRLFILRIQRGTSAVGRAERAEPAPVPGAPALGGEDGPAEVMTRPLSLPAPSEQLSHPRCRLRPLRPAL